MNGIVRSKHDKFPLENAPNLEKVFDLLGKYVPSFFHHIRLHYMLLLYFVLDISDSTIEQPIIFLPLTPRKNMTQSAFSLRVWTAVE